MVKRENLYEGKKLKIIADNSSDYHDYEIGEIVEVRKSIMKDEIIVESTRLESKPRIYVKNKKEEEKVVRFDDVVPVSKKIRRL